MLHPPTQLSAACPVHATSCYACVAAPATLHPGVRGAAFSWPCLRCGWPALGTRLSANVSSASLVRSPMYACSSQQMQYSFSATPTQREQMHAKHAYTHVGLQSRKGTNNRVSQQYTERDWIPSTKQNNSNTPSPAKDACRRKIQS
jgi:hypothetical protein